MTGLTLFDRTMGAPSEVTPWFTQRKPGQSMVSCTKLRGWSGVYPPECGNDGSERDRHDSVPELRHPAAAAPGLVPGVRLPHAAPAPLAVALAHARRGHRRHRLPRRHDERVRLRLAAHRLAPAGRPA